MITIDNPQDPAIQAIFLKGALRLMSVGMSHSRMSKTEALTIATTLTGNKYLYPISHDCICSLF